MDCKLKFERILARVVRGTLSERRAVDLLLNEMSRGGRTLVVDEDLRGLERELAGLRYTTELLPAGLLDPQIKPLLRSRVFITGNGIDFIVPEHMDRYYYGVIWIDTKSRDYPTLAGKVQDVLKTHNFGKNLVQVVKVGEKPRVINRRGNRRL